MHSLWDEAVDRLAFLAALFLVAGISDCGLSSKGGHSFCVMVLVQVDCSTSAWMSPSFVLEGRRAILGPIKLLHDLITRLGGS